MKKCPFCAELIQDAAVKCRYCGSIIADFNKPVPTESNISGEEIAHLISDTKSVEPQRKKGSILSAIFWMIFLSIILCWLPLFGYLIAGFVGGKKAGGALRGFLACLIPAAFIAFGLTSLLSSLLPGALLGIIGGSVTILLLISIFPLICGAIIGGALAK